ncbi:hypothetical protein OSTOST_14418 [Ostertagia ostertagi]
MSMKSKCYFQEHALADDVSGPLGELAYDENLNEVADIGSDVDEIEGMDATTASTMVSTLQDDKIMPSRRKCSTKPSARTASIKRGKVQMSKRKGRTETRSTTQASDIIIDQTKHPEDLRRSERFQTTGR